MVMTVLGSPPVLAKVRRKLKFVEWQFGMWRKSQKDALARFSEKAVDSSSCAAWYQERQYFSLQATEYTP